MPIPKPKAGEKRRDFMTRCMSDNTMVNEYGKDQRLAICSTSFKDNFNKQDENRISKNKGSKDKP
jgi:hypothetical protein